MISRNGNNEIIGKDIFLGISRKRTMAIVEMIANSDEAHALRARINPLISQWLKAKGE